MGAHWGLHEKWILRSLNYTRTSAAVAGLFAIVPSLSRGASEQLLLGARPWGLWELWGAPEIHSFQHEGALGDGNCLKRKQFTSRRSNRSLADTRVRLASMGAEVQILSPRPFLRTEARRLVTTAGTLPG